MGIRTERAAALVRILEEEGWIPVIRTPQPRQVLFSVEERRATLAHLRGAPPEHVRLSDPAEGLVTPGDSEAALSKGLNAAVCDLECEAEAVLQRRPIDFGRLTDLLQRIDGLIDVALDQSDPRSFDMLTNARRRVKRRLEN